MAYGLTKSAHLVAASSQYFSVADAVPLRVVNGWTVEMSLKMATGNAGYAIVSRSGEDGWGITFTNTTGSNYVVRPSAGSGAFDGADGTININDGNFHHIKVIFNGASTKIYVDNVLDSTVSIPNITNPNTTVYIGAKNGGTSPFFNGQVSLVRIWDHQHTTADQCTVYGTTTANLKAEWSLDNVLTDGSGNANTLTNVNSATFTSDIPSTCAGTLYTKTLTETITDTDSILRTATKVLTQTVSHTDTIIRTASRALTEAIAQTASALKTAGRVLIETLGLTDSFTEGLIIASGPRNPGTGATSSSGAPAPYDWINTGNVTASDNTYTTASGDNSWDPNNLICSDYGFSIPAPATINGIYVEVDRKASIASHSVDWHIRLQKASTSVGSDKADTVTTWPTTETTAAYGGSTDLWGTTWTPSDVNNSGFGLSLAVTSIVSGGNGYSVDHIRITVYYTLAGNLYSQTYTEAVALADTLIKTASRTLFETVATVDTFIRSTSRALLETVTLTATGLNTTGRTLAETISQTSTFAYLRTAASTLTETISVTPAFLRSMVRTFSEVLTNTDTLISLRVIPLMLSEAISMTATLVKTGGKVLAEVFTLTDTFIRSATRTLTETITASDSVVAFSARVATLLEAITHTDTLLRSITRVLVETVTQSDTLTSLKVYARTLTETVTSTASMVRVIARSLSEAITQTAAFTRVMAYTRTFSESIAVSATIRILRNGLAIIWRNAARGAAAVLSNAARAVTNLINEVRGSTTWDNEDRS